MMLEFCCKFDLNIFLNMSSVRAVHTVITKHRVEKGQCLGWFLVGLTRGGNIYGRKAACIPYYMVLKIRIDL